MVKERTEIAERLETDLASTTGRLVWDKRHRLRGRVTRAWIEDGRVRIEIQRMSRVPREGRLVSGG